MLGLLAASCGAVSAQTPPQDQQNSSKLKEELREEFKKWLTCEVHWMFTSYTTGSDLTVKVARNGTPMPGVSVALERREPRSAIEAAFQTWKTDSEGVVKFFAVPRGEYTVSIEELAAPDVVWVDVHPDSNSTDDIVLEWPNTQYSVRNLRGPLLADDGGKPMEGVLVELLDVRSSYLLASTRTDAIGYYQLSAPGRGIYTLRFSLPATKWGNRDVDVSVSDKGAEQMPLLELDEDCGSFFRLAAGSRNSPPPN